MRLEVDTSKETFQIVPDPKFGKGHFISEPNLKKRVEQGLKAWNELSCPHEFETIISNSKYTVQKCSLCQKIKKE